MRNWVNEWVQEGRLCVWRCSDAEVGRRGLAVDGGSRRLPVGQEPARSDAGRRALPSQPQARAGDRGNPPRANAGYAVAERFGRLRIDHRPELDALRAEPDGETLDLAVGGRRLRKLSAALGRVEVGDGDFEVDPGGHETDSWMFWWMPNVKYWTG